MTIRWWHADKGIPELRTLAPRKGVELGRAGLGLACVNKWKEMAPAGFQPPGTYIIFQCHSQSHRALCVCFIVFKWGASPPIKVWTCQRFRNGKKSKVTIFFFYFFIFLHVGESPLQTCEITIGYWTSTDNSVAATVTINTNLRESTGGQVNPLQMIHMGDHLRVTPLDVTSVGMNHSGEPNLSELESCSRPRVGWG